MIEPSVWVALIISGGALVTALVGTLISPFIAAYINRKQIEAGARTRKEEIAEREAREDEVARRVEESNERTRLRAEAAAQEVARAAALLVETTQAATVSATEQKELSQKIYRLVDGRATEEMEAKLDLSNLVLELLKERVELKRDVGTEPAANVLEQIEAIKISIQNLVANIADRKRITGKLDRGEV